MKEIELTDHDQKEIEKFFIYLRLIYQTRENGINDKKVEQLIYQDIYNEGIE